MLAALLLVGIAATTPANLAFQDGPLGAAPPGWLIRGSKPESYTVAVRAEEGARALVIAGSSDGFVTPLQRVDAHAWRGRTLEFTGKLRFRGEPGKGWGNLWVRVDGTGPKSLAFDNMRDRFVTSSDWTPARIVLQVPAEAETLTLGVMLNHAGELSAKDLAVQELSVDSAPLTARGLENLVAYTRLLGYVRHFDPADGAAGTDWRAFTLSGIERAEGAADPAALARVLQDQFGPLDPVLVIGTRPVTIDSLALVPADSIATWAHLGWPGEDTTRKRGFYIGLVLRVGPGLSPERPGPVQSIRESLGAGVFCAVPLLLWADAKGTLPHAPKPVVPELPTAPWAGDRATRLAGVALCWNVLQHFYPYFDVVGTDWDAALREALKSAATEADASAYLATLQRLTAHLEDGHVGVSGPGDPLPFVAPFSWDWAEGQLVITAASDSLGADLKRGDVVRTLDGVPVDVRYREVATRLSAATEGYRRHVALGRMPGPQHPALVLGIERADGTHKDVSVPASNRFLPFGFTRPAPIAEVRPGIWYVDVQRVDDARFDAAVDTLASAKGVIFDVRGYPSRLMHQPLAHVADSVMTSPQWHIPIVGRPDHKDLTFRFSNWTIKPLAPRFRGKIAFLIDARAISYAETWLGIVERYRLGALVGEPTAGTNGNVTTIALPGGYTVSFTGMKVLKHDGSRHHGVGIHPTIPVAPTVAGIRAGRDEVLEQGIRAVGG